MKKGDIVFVGLSGGVDSSVAALRLKRAGYTVVGVFIRVWHPDFITCSEEADRLDAMRTAAALEIPFLTCDAREAYKAQVADEMIREYRAGRTPNPDVLCNKVVKFGVFEDFRKARGAAYIATGHYARTQKNHNDNYELLTAVDKTKDQSYFLSQIDASLLQHVLFPIGDTKKDAIRTEALQAKLPSARRPDSQGICFLGKLDMKEFLSHYIAKEQGDVVDTHGAVIGTHDGALFYTIGQRHGFRVTSKETEAVPLYVVEKDIDGNKLIVDIAQKVSAAGTDYTLIDLNLLAPIVEHTTYDVVTRYHGERSKATVSNLSSKSCHIHLTTAGPTSSLGQTCVLYDGERVLGGGIIESYL
jgi:tRNA-uridine 2-sulfurtransferase